MKKSTPPTIVYKILREIDGRLWSWSPPTGCDQHYSTDKINRPLIPGSYIFAFETLQAAQEFDRGFTFKVIYKCEATGVNRRRKLRLQTICDKTDAKKFWKSSDPRRFYTQDLSHNVVLVKTLRLIERVA